MQIKSITEYQARFKDSLESSFPYWESVGDGFHWFKRWTKVLEGGFPNRAHREQTVRWFVGGELNITVNALDRHVEKHPQKIAIYFEPNDPEEKGTSYTYEQLLARVNQFALVLKKQKVKKGDVVCFYMAMVPELMIGVLACARIGAIHNVVFGGFSATSLAARLEDSAAKILITQDEGYRGDKLTPLKQIADEALEMAKKVQTVLVLERTGGDVPMKLGRDQKLTPLLDQEDKKCTPEKMNAEDPLFILYTSGSTGKPKGLLHTTAGYMVWVAETFSQVFQMEKDDLYWCAADLGWITGHSYIAYGPLLNGVSQVMFEGIPTHPDAGRFWSVIEKYSVTHFYTAPTAIRALQAHDLSFVQKYNLESLKVLGSVGEPINEEAWQWYHDHIGRGKCAIVDTWWQTETGGVMISSLAGVTPSIPTFATLPMPGVAPALLTLEGKEIEAAEAEGLLCIKRPWPGMARTIFGDHKRYIETYFSTYEGYYFTGDGARRDADGNYRIIGRVDDVVNVSGHRIGTAEVEDAINEHLRIVESAVVGVPHPIKGQGIVAFITLMDNESEDSDLLLKEVNALITKKIGAIAKLENLLIVSGLPKTRSGKIMRRILRKAAAHETDSIGDTSTLLNPEVVDEIIAKMASFRI
jgi:acetyl-CoA synthetase